ncbi:hypothetical protein KPZU09_04990 [Klebsiella pneumoniae]|uniref:Pyridine nucleotide-disulphide oxidoreductase N-terminal domain-containing protein n=1 Tax=Klebsiella pneumoniae TaxID=573 RepID=A0A919HLJ9_KLEPN|nr:hypothetical protein KPZU09_04990 [Klebsiella pneumoniae]
MVIGGGLLGLEAANALKQLGLETQVVEFAPNLMAVQLDNGGAAMLRRRSSPSAWGAYQQSDHRHRARGRRPAAELCRRRRVADRHGGLLGGIRPQDALARGCALQVGERGEFTSTASAVPLTRMCWR